MIEQYQTMNSANEFAETTTIVAADHCISTVVDGETVILHQDAGEYYSVNEVGTLIWELIQQPQTLDDLSRAIVSEYDVAYEQCQSDVSEMLAEMANENLVRLDE